MVWVFAFPGVIGNRLDMFKRELAEAGMKGEIKGVPHNVGG
jgi:hypothetical protein